MFTWTSQSRFSGYKRCLCFISRLGSTQCLTPKQFMKLQFDIGELHPQEKLNTLHKISFSRGRDGWEILWLKSPSTGGNSVKPIFNWVQFYLCTSTARSAKSELQNFTGWATLSMCEHSLVSKGRILLGLIGIHQHTSAPHSISGEAACAKIWSELGRWNENVLTFMTI